MIRKVLSTVTLLISIAAAARQKLLEPKGRSRALMTTDYYCYSDDTTTDYSTGTVSYSGGDCGFTSSSYELCNTGYEACYDRTVSCDYYNEETCVYT